MVVLWGHPSARAAEALDCPVLSFEDVTAWGGDHTGAGAAWPPSYRRLTASASCPASCKVAAPVSTLGYGRRPFVRLPACADDRHVRLADFAADLAAMSPNSLATLVYTSGTTGRPKVGSSSACAS